MKLAIKLLLIVAILFTSTCTYSDSMAVRGGQSSRPEAAEEEVFYPSEVLCFPRIVKVPENPHKVPPTLDDFLRKRNFEINLRQLAGDPELSAMGSDGLRDLIVLLSKFKLKIEFSDADGKILSGKCPPRLKKYSPIGTRDKTNAAVALAFLLILKRNDELAAKVISVAPSEIIDGLHNHGYKLFSPKVLIGALVGLARSIDIGPEYRDRALFPQGDGADFDDAAKIKYCANLVEKYIHYWARKDPKKIEKFLKKLGEKLTQTNLGSERVGLLLGSILSGSCKLVAKIKSTDQCRIYFILIAIGVANAALGFLFAFISPNLPLVVIRGLISLGVALIPPLYVFRCGQPRDYWNVIKEVQGRIELYLLQGMNRENERDVHAILDWMGCAMHINGHSN